MPRKSLQGRTCGVSCDGGRARALQPGRRSVDLQLIYQRYPGPRSTTPKTQRLGRAGRARALQPGRRSSDVGCAHLALGSVVCQSLK
ncbi:hypothetical protein XarjCFBP1022_19765 [Xanthomonas arboricola]|nr:hypothetical protein XarjCFBP1022_19765 [Xanthomonas arboricola]